STTTSCSGVAGWCRDWLRAHIPTRRLNSGLHLRVGNRELTHRLSRRVAHTKFEIAHWFVDEILNHRFVRWILADEVIVSPELVVALILRLPLQCGARRKQLGICAYRFGA